MEDPTEPGHDIASGSYEIQKVSVRVFRVTWALVLVHPETGMHSAIHLEVHQTESPQQW